MYPETTSLQTVLDKKHAQYSSCVRLKDMVICSLLSHELAKLSYGISRVPLIKSYGTMTYIVTSFTFGWFTFTFTKPQNLTNP
jgi:hypothetical protein